MNLNQGKKEIEAFNEQYDKLIQEADDGREDDSDTDGQDASGESGGDDSATEEGPRGDPFGPLEEGDPAACAATETERQTLN